MQLVFITKTVIFPQYLKFRFQISNHCSTVGRLANKSSERLTCFPCWKSNQVTLFWCELFRMRSRRKVSIITFPVSYNGSKAILFLHSYGGENHANQAFFHVFPVPENISLQCGESTENAA